MHGAADAPVARDDSEQQQRGSEPLFDAQRANELRDRWYALQARFVDDPQETVQDADSLVAELLQELARGFSEARTNLEQQWSSGGDASTEDLRPDAAALPLVLRADARCLEDEGSRPRAATAVVSAPRRAA